MIKTQVNQEVDQTISQSLPPKLNTDNDLLKLKEQLNSYFLKFTQDLKSDPKMDDYLKQINLTSEIILQSYRKIIETNDKLFANAANNSVIRHAAETYFTFLLNLLKAKSTEGLDSKGRLVWYAEVETKLHCCLQLFHNYKEKEDITSSPKQQYPKVWQRCRFQSASNPKNVKKQYKEMKKILHIAVCASIIESNYSLSLVQKIVFGLSFPRYMIMNDQAKLKSLQFYRSPTLQSAQRLWNLPQLGATKQLSKITYDSIKTNMKLYIPADGKYENTLNIFEQGPNTITVRLLHNKKIEKFPEQERSGCCLGDNRKIQYLEEVIFHMHGGGFIALSSRSMQIYTRTWAKQLNIPVFSIDYRMPPDHLFPQAPLDCFTVYQFLINHIHKFINIRPKSLYVAGDSAGGNLSCSLTGLILKHKQLTPKGLYLMYPATDMRFTFTSSRLNSLTDPLLWPSTLLLCLNAYLNGDHEKAKDPLASPILLTEQYVSGTDDQRFPLKWPKTVISVGNRDPLYDDSLMLMNKMVQSGIDCQCIIYQELSHGYMNTTLMVKQTEKTIEQSVDHLRKLIKQTSEK